MIQLSERQLQKEFKHAADFNVSSKYNLQTAVAFEAAIKAHLQNPRMQAITGSYRSQPVTHYQVEVESLQLETGILKTSKRL